MMQKINMKTEVVKVLDSVTSLADFSTDYPEDMTVFPYAVYRTIASPHFVDANRDEVQTRWQVLIEIYGTKSVSSIATSVYNGMRGMGFKVTQRDSNVSGFNRIVLDCHGIVDNAMRQVYL